MSNDELLRRYLREDSQAAFALLVRRHVDLVYSAALRQVRQPQLAEEVAQAVFVDLARQARTLPADQPVSAWLYVVTRRTAIDVVRREVRRRAGEGAAAALATMRTESTGWTEIAAVLDEAMAALEPNARSAILLHYFENHSLRDVGATTEDLRKTWKDTREAAYAKLKPILQAAIRDFAAASNGVSPSDLGQLLPYLKQPFDAAILQRYEIADRINHSTRAVSGAITERAPVDVDFDNRHTLSLTGREAGSSLWTLDSFRQAHDDAMRDFYAANPGRRPESADLLPYIRDPAAKAIFEAQLASAKDPARTGKSADLRPYVTDPAARALLEKMIAAEERRTAQ